MELPNARQTVPELVWLDQAESTNSELRARLLAAGGDIATGTVVATANQTAGQGRRGREWITPPDTALAMSMLVRPRLTDTSQLPHSAQLSHSSHLPLGWVPLLAGSAVAATLQPLFTDHRVGVKWPNDVHVRTEADARAGATGAKLTGILCEAVAGGSVASGSVAGDATVPTVIVGIGINLLMRADQLPTARATSLLAAGGDTGGGEASPEAAARLFDRVLSGVSAELLRLLELAEVNPGAAKARVRRDSLTIGSRVRAHLPGGDQVEGIAAGLADDGSLIIELPTAEQFVVSAADIEHLR